MLPSAFSNSPESLEPREFEQLIQDGIAAVKLGDLPLAKRLLEQAALINSGDVRIWIWLSATTQDLEKRQNYLERAVAIDPANTTAKRGLLLVKEKLEKERLASVAETYTSQRAASPEEANTRTYTCPNCGAAISYNINEKSLVCQFCGFTRKIDERVASESSAPSQEAVTPAPQAPPWVEGQERVACERCGTVLIFPPGQAADVCPYCGSNRFTGSPSIHELLDPQVIGLCSVDAESAVSSVKTWISKGLLAPDDAAVQQVDKYLQRAYYPFWLFDGTLEVPWFCDVNVGSGGAMVWEAQTGSHQENFKDILIPGLRKMPLADLMAIEPFNLSEVVEFSPDHLSGSTTLIYDHPLADASLRAREEVVKQVRTQLHNLVDTDRHKRNLSIGTAKWSSLTYKLALLPIYIGNYPFQGKRYRLFVNGQTGKVSGKKPIDNFKLAMYAVGGIILLAIIITILWILGNSVLG